MINKIGSSSAPCGKSISTFDHLASLATKHHSCSLVPTQMKEIPQKYTAIIPQKYTGVLNDGKVAKAMHVHRSQNSTLSTDMNISTLPFSDLKNKQQKQMQCAVSWQILPFVKNVKNATQEESFS